MLSIGKVGGAGGHGKGPDYYEAAVAQGEEDYYAGRGEARGEWLGRGATALGLAGELADGDLAELLEWRHPKSGDLLVGRPSATGTTRAVAPRPGSVRGYDLTFRAPKSVSVLYGVGSPEVSRAVREGHDAAVRDGLGYLEREACLTRRGRDGHERLRGEGVVAGAFRHRTSRAGDPQLHTHVVCANLTRADGRFTTLDGRAVYAHARTAGFLYQARLRAELTERLGVEWGAVERGVADLVGVPREVIEAFSQRRAEILAHMAERGERGERAAQVATLATRRAKEHGIPDRTLRDGWRERAAELGFDEAVIAKMLERPRPEPPAARELGQLAARLAGHHGLTREASSFDRRDVLRGWCEALGHGAEASEIEALADQFLADARLSVCLGSPQLSFEDHLARPGGPRYSTPPMVRLEERLVASARDRRGEGAGIADPAAIRAAAERRPLLSSEQQAMLERLTRSGDGVEVVLGWAGAGKTFALDACREAWERSGRVVVGCALSARAAAELRDGAGIRSATIASLLSDINRGHALAQGSVLVVDEAGMVGTRQLAQLARHAEGAGTKLVLVGDDRQLPEIQTGGAFRSLAERLGSIELRTVRRQHEPWDREALAALREGAAGRFLAAYREHGRLTLGRTAEETRAAIVSDWWDAHTAEPDGQAVMLALRRSDVRELNDQARALMRESGALGDEELEAAGRAFSAGDRVVGLRNDRRVGVVNGDRGMVAWIDEQRRELGLACDDGREVTLPAAYLEQGNLDHGYALTAHKAQGMTVERTFVLGTEESYGEWAYTALSRHRVDARFYATAPEPPEVRRARAPQPAPWEELERGLSRSRAKELAIDIRDEALRSAPKAELEAEAERLSKALLRRSLEIADENRLERELTAARESKERLAAQLERLRAQAPRSWLERRRDPTHPERLQSARARHTRCEAREGELAEELTAFREQRSDRLRGDERERLATIRQELAERQGVEHDVAARLVCHEPREHVIAALGERPQSPLAGVAWERAAVALERYRLDHPEDADAERAPLGPVPPGSEGPAAWTRTARTIDATREDLGREPVGRETLAGRELADLDLGPDLGL